MSQDEIKEAMQKWLMEIAYKQGYNVCLTFQFNKKNITEDEARRAMRVAFGTLYRKKFGRNWSLQKDKQYKFIGFCENGRLRDNLHYHLMMKVELKIGTIIQLQMLLNKGTRKIVPSANILCRAMYDNEWAAYISKEVSEWNNTLITEKDLW